MLHILICCNNGFSSSFLARKMQKELQARGLKEELTIDYADIYTMKKDKKNCDVILLCPQSYLEVLISIQHEKSEIPFYMLPPKLYASMNFDAIIEDAIDITALYQKTPLHPMHFPKEENIMSIKRSCSYRRWSKTN